MRSFFQNSFKQEQTLFKHRITSSAFSKKASIHLGQWDILETKNSLCVVESNEDAIHVADACLKTTHSDEMIGYCHLT